MFKKRGQRNFRRKAESSEDDDETERAGKKGTVSVGGVALPGLALGAAARSAPSPAPASASSASLLSFPAEDEDEDGDTPVRLKKSTLKRLGKLKKAAKAPPSPDSTHPEHQSPPPPAPKALPPKPPPPPPPKARPVVTVEVEEADSSTGDLDSVHAYNPDSRLRTAMKSGNIPDAQMVFMARKRRQAAREGGDVIPVDDVQKYRRSKGRLQREEDEDGCSSGEEGGRFYSKSANLSQEEETRRRGEEAFLEVEQGASSGEDEFGQWERDQIRKCLPGDVVTQMEAQAEAQKKKRLYAQYGTLGPLETEEIKEEEMELDSADTEPGKAPSPDQIPLPPSGRPVSLGMNGRGPKLGGGTGQSTRKPSNLADLLAKLNIGLGEAESLIRAKELEREKLDSHLAEVETSIAGLEASEPRHQAQFQIFQEAQAYVRDLLDCLDEKAPKIEEVMEKLYKLVGGRAEALWKRHRTEIRDEYDEVIAGNTDKPQQAKDPQLLLRIAERQGRRTRRRQEREKQGRLDSKHNDGESTDEEEIPSRIATFQIDLKKLKEEAEEVMGDTLEEFGSVGAVVGAFQRWVREDPDSFSDAFIALNFPKLLSPLIKLQLLQWNPIGSAPIDSFPPMKLEEMEWYKDCLRLGNEETDDPSITDLIPNIVDKVVLPHLTGLVRGSWNVSSSRQSELVWTTLEEIRSYPSVRADSGSVSGLLEAVHGRARECIDDDLFTPIFPADASPEAKAFLDRQFWSALKVLGNLTGLRDWVSSAGLEELAVDGVLNRHLVLSLQSSSLTSAGTLGKARAIVGAVPSAWPAAAANPAQFAPLVKVLWRMGEALYDDRASRDTLKDVYKLLQRLEGKSKAEKFLLNYVR